MIRLVLCGFLLLAFVAGGLWLHLAFADYRMPVWVLCGSAAAYLGIVALALRSRPVRGGVWVVLLFAVAMRVPMLMSPPFLSSDIYRYVWDGRVQDAGINPYRYVPEDPALAGLRDAAVYPNINRAAYAHTIYPPAAQAFYAAVALVWPSVAGMKVAMLGWDAVAVGCLLLLLLVAELPAERVLIYAWNPLLVWAFAGNGHIDAMVCGLTAAALLFRVKRLDGWAGLALGLAVATKFLPAVLAPVLWRGRWRLGVVASVVVLGLYAVYSSVGWQVFGFLGGYGREEGLDDGSGFWLVGGLGRLVALPSYASVVYIGAAVVALAALGVWFAFVRRPHGAVAICSAAGVMMAVLTFAISPHYPWYFCWLAVPCVVAPSPAVLWLSAAPALIYLDNFGDSFIWPSVIYLPAVLLALPWARWNFLGFRPVVVEGNT